MCFICIDFPLKVAQRETDLNCVCVCVKRSLSISQRIVRYKLFAYWGDLNDSLKQGIRRKYIFGHSSPRFRYSSTQIEQKHQ